MYKLYYDPGSANMAPHAVLEEIGAPHELVLVDIDKGEHRGAAYLEINPHGRVPTLVEDDFVLYESTAILEYLEACFPAPALVPADARGRALVAMHMKL